MTTYVQGQNRTSHWIFFSLDINIYWGMSYCQYQCFSFFLFFVGPFIGSISDYDIVKGKNNKLADACQKDTLNVKYSANNNILYKYIPFCYTVLNGLRLSFWRNKANGWSWDGNFWCRCVHKIFFIHFIHIKKWILAVSIWTEWGRMENSNEEAV